MLGSKQLEKLSENAIYQGSADWLSIRIQVNEIGENDQKKLFIPNPPYSALYCQQSSLQIYRSEDNFFFDKQSSFPCSGVRVPLSLDFELLEKLKKKSKQRVASPKSPINPEEKKKQNGKQDQSQEKIQIQIKDENRKLINKILEQEKKKDPKVLDLKDHSYITLKTCNDTLHKDIFFGRLISRFKPSKAADLFRLQPGHYVESPRCIQCNTRLILQDLITIFNEIDPTIDPHHITFWYEKHESSQSFQKQSIPDLPMLAKLVQMDISHSSPLTKRDWGVLEKRLNLLLEQQLKAQKLANQHIDQNNGISKLQTDQKNINKFYIDFVKLIKTRQVHDKHQNIQLLKETCQELKRLNCLLDIKIEHLEKLKQ